MTDEALKTREVKKLQRVVVKLRRKLKQLEGKQQGYIDAIKLILIEVDSIIGKKSQPVLDPDEELPEGFGKL